MRRARFAVVLALAGSALAGCKRAAPPAVATGSFDVDQATKLKAAIASPERPPQEVARDDWRHPLQTLTFFELRDDQKVIELAPGSGWYTAILAPLLVAKGSLAVVTPAARGAADGGVEMARAAQKYTERLAAKPAVFGKVQVRTIDSPASISLGPDGSADLVVTFRNFHNWVKAGIAADLLSASFRVLKSGGVLGIEEHRAAGRAETNRFSDPKIVATTVVKIGETGYVPEGYVIELARKAGFTLEARSEINANPRDTRDWPKGVWTLPPTLRLGEQDRAKYQQIGESDRMTLRFRKP